MTTKEAMSALEKIRNDAHAQYPENGPRLQQLDHALATAAMAYEYLVDEDLREKEFRARLRKDRQLFEKHAHQVRGGADAIFEEAS